MRHQSITLLLALAVIAAGCGKSNYAQVEPDDLYFTHKDRKAVFGEEVIPGSPMVTTVEPTEVPTEYERSEYSDQHSPVFETPYGSPTIQQYGQKPYYDTTVNPDYLYEEDYSDLDNTSSAYFDENYSYQAPPAYETPVVNNYYYGLPGGYSYPSSMWLGSSYYTSYRPWRTSVYIGYDPYGWYYPSYYYSGYYSSYYSGWYDPYYAWGGSYYNPYCGFGNTYYGGGYGNYYTTTYNNNFDSYYKNGTKVVTQPRQSRNQVSYEVDKDNLPIKSRRADYIPQAEGASGRVASTTSRSSSETSPTISRRGSSSVYQYTNNENRGKDGQDMGTRNSSTVTVQQTRNSAQSRYSNNRTVVVPTRTRSTYTNRESAGSQDRYTRTNNANRTTSNRSAVNKRTTTPTTRYSNTTTRTRSSNYGTRSNNSSRSRSIFGTRSSGSSNSSGTRTRSYTPSRSSSGFSTPSRSSGSSSRSYTPSRSSSSRSSGTKSSSSSSGRSSGRRN